MGPDYHLFAGAPCSSQETDANLLSKPVQRDWRVRHDDIELREDVRAVVELVQSFVMSEMLMFVTVKTTKKFIIEPIHSTASIMLQ